MSARAPEETFAQAKSLRRLVKSLASSGLAQLNEAEAKQVRKICKSDAAAVPCAFDLLFGHLRRPHAQERLSAFQMTDQLFQRSHAFRELVAENFQELMLLTAETDPAKPLPPPRAARQQLKKLVWETVPKWVEKFGTGYKKLELGYNFLKQVRKVPFGQPERPSEAAARRQTKLDNIWRERVKRVKHEMEETKQDWQDCVTQVENCLSLIIPRPENFGFAADAAGAGKQGDDEVVPSHHGMVSGQTSVSVDLDSESVTSPVETADPALMENLHDQFRLLVSRWLPMAKKWTVILSKATGCDADELQQLLRASIEIKERLEESFEKCEQIGISSMDYRKKRKRKRVDEESDSDDDDDLIEVEEMGCLEKSVPEVDAAAIWMQKDVEDDKSQSWTAAPSSASWKLDLLRREEESDPTTFSATMKKMRGAVDPGGCPRPGSPQPSTSKTKRLPFDVDLYDWGEQKEPTKVLVDSEKLRFWGCSTVDEEMEVPQSQETLRKIEFSGEFEPVSRSCRAPLPSGRLCPRQDRFKCPLHGPVIDRDDMGRPTDPDLRRREDEKKERADADWQDPQLLKELKAATGVDLRMPKKGQRLKERTSDRPGLVALKDTSRKRLERKVFNRSAAKRVAETLNRLDATKHKDKFADQFNYVFQQ